MIMLNHKGTAEIKTKRLLLRRFTVNDAQAMYDNWASDKLVVKYTSWDVHASPEATRELITGWISEYDKPEYYNWVIEFEGYVIGTINIHNISDNAQRCEIGYCIGSKFWNRGIVTEAALAITKFAFEEIGVNKVCAMHDIENIGSGCVMQKIGMTREGLLRQHSHRKDGSFGDLAFCGILKEEWIKRNEN
jgi:RimJ/RimL family protein N-acetyltransferase